jgi:LysM repeat protein
LVNSIAMPSSKDWVLTSPDHGFATQETVDALSLCLTRVHEQFSATQPTRLGSISAVRGGRISPHKSHRTGRDADVYFFRKPGARWNRAATESDIDLAPTWALLRCFITETDVDMVLIDKRVQGWLQAHALASGESKEWIKALFHDQKEPRQMAVVRHEPGHVAHMHVRFSSPKARRAGVAAYDRLQAAGLVVPKVQSLSHRVKQGETLSGIARKFGIPVQRIKSLNHLQSNLIRVGQELSLQQAVDILGARDAVGVPARRRPPSETPLTADAGLQIAAKSPSGAPDVALAARPLAQSERAAQPDVASASPVVPARPTPAAARPPPKPALPTPSPESPTLSPELKRVRELPELPPRSAS